MTKYLKLFLTAFVLTGLSVSAQASEIVKDEVEQTSNASTSKPSTSGVSAEDSSTAAKKSRPVNVGYATAIVNWLTKFIRWEMTNDVDASKATSRFAFLKSKKFLAATGVAVLAVGAYWYDPETAVSYGKYILTPILGSYFGVDVPGDGTNPGSGGDSGAGFTPTPQNNPVG